MFIGWYLVIVLKDILEEEQEKYPIPNKPGEFYKTRMDMKNLKRYGKLEFMDAAEEMGMFGNLRK